MNDSERHSLFTHFGTYDRRTLDVLGSHDCAPGAVFVSQKVGANYWSLRGREYWCTECGMIKRTSEGRT